MLPWQQQRCQATAAPTAAATKQAALQNRQVFLLYAPTPPWQVPSSSDLLLKDSNEAPYSNPVLLGSNSQDPVPLCSSLAPHSSEAISTLHCKDLDEPPHTGNPMLCWSSVAHPDSTSLYTHPWLPQCWASGLEFIGARNRDVGSILRGSAGHR